MGNRTKYVNRGRQRKKLIKTVYLGQTGDFPRFVYGYLKKIGHIKEDGFSKWVQDMIKRVYKSRDFQEIEAQHIFVQVVNLHNEIVGMVRKKDSIIERLRELGYEADLLNSKLLKTKNKPKSD